MPLPKNNMLFGFADKLTEEQKAYVDSIFDNQLTICNSPAGTGKSTLAVAAAKLLGKPLTYVFSPVEEDKMGHRPGSQEEKVKAYLTPLLDGLEEIGEIPSQVMYSETNIEGMKNGSVWVYPMAHTFLRGSNLRDCTVIIDEAQNFTVHELKKTLTRIKPSTKVILIGHSEQCDLKNPSLSGFKRYIEHYRNEPYAKICNLSLNFRGQLAAHADRLEV